MPITEAEKQIVEDLGKIADKIVQLPVLVLDDQPDAYYHIRAIQNMILARSAFRVLHNIENNEG